MYIHCTLLPSYLGHGANVLQDLVLVIFRVLMLVSQEKSCSHFLSLVLLHLSGGHQTVYNIVCVCVCVRERERKGEKEGGEEVGVCVGESERERTNRDSIYIDCCRQTHFPFNKLSQCVFHMKLNTHNVHCTITCTCIYTLYTCTCIIYILCVF